MRMAVLFACLIAFVALPLTATATPVTLTFSGTFNTGDDGIFGLSGPAVPFNFTITYDPEMATYTEP